MKIDIWVFFESLLRKFKFYCNLTRITGTLHEDNYTFLIISRSFLLTMNNVSHKVVEKIKTHILCPMTFFRKSCRLWDNVEKYGTAGQAHRWQYGACALHAGYLRLKHTLICYAYAFLLQQWLYEHTSMLHHTHTACIVPFTGMTFAFCSNVMTILCS